MSDKSISSLKVNDTAYMFGGPNRGGRSGATGGIQVSVRKVGRSYIYVARAKPGGTSGWSEDEIKFDIKTGIEADVDNYKRLLVVDGEAYQAELNTQIAYSKLRSAFPTRKPPNLSMADIQAAAKLLGVDLEG